MKKTAKGSQKRAAAARKSLGKKNFSIVIVGTGGQGLITLLEILANAAKNQGYDTKTSELHGLSQRGGSVEVHVKFGKKIYSPLVTKASADLILGLEMQECLKAAYFAGPNTHFLINKNITPIPEQTPIPAGTIVKNLSKFTKNIDVVDANAICQKALETSVVSGTYLLSLAVLTGVIPIGKEHFKQAIKQSIAPKYLELNEKTYKLAETNAKTK